MGMTSNDEKKKFLRSYRDSVRRAERIDSEIEEIRAIKMSTSSGGGGSRCKGQKNDLSGYVAKLDALERRLEKEKCDRIHFYETVEKVIGSLENEQERDVLFYRYIKGMAWWEIVEKMGYSERWVYWTHGRALAHLKISKDCIELQ